MRKLALIMMAGALTVLISMQAFAASQPSSKVAVAGGTLTALSKAQAAQAGTTTSADGLVTDDTKWVTVMGTSIKVPNDKGLALDVAIQSAIITFTEVRSKGGSKETSTATGRINVRVKLTDEDDNVTFAAPSEGNDVEGDMGVTYSYRLQTLSAAFQGLCIEDDGTVLPIEECDPEVVSLLLETLTANAFNFYYGPTDAGVYKIEVQARAQASAQIFSVDGGEATGEAYVGLGSMLVETVRLIHGTGFEVNTLE